MFCLLSVLQMHEFIFKFQQSGRQSFILLLKSHFPSIIIYQYRFIENRYKGVHRYSLIIETNYKIIYPIIIIHDPSVYYKILRSIVNIILLHQGQIIDIISNNFARHLFYNIIMFCLKSNFVYERQEFNLLDIGYSQRNIQ